jgi:hypothetical protein
VVGMHSNPQVQDQSPERYDLGVLFVHGIGDQQQCSTARFGGSLQRWRPRWLDPDGAPPDRGLPEMDRIAPEPLVQVTEARRRTALGDARRMPACWSGDPGNHQSRGSAGCWQRVVARRPRIPGHTLTRSGSASDG